MTIVMKKMFPGAVGYHLSDPSAIGFTKDGFWLRHECTLEIKFEHHSLVIHTSEAVSFTLKEGATHGS